MSLTNKLLSGIEFAQNVATTTTPLSASLLYQEFYLPDDIERGSRAGEIRVPELSGFSVLADVPVGTKDTIELDWVLQREVFGVGWVPVENGKVVGAQVEGTKVWIDIYFEDLVIVDPAALSDKFRVGVSTPLIGVNLWCAPASGYPIAVDGNVLTFRVFTASGDRGTDFLGNPYRHALFAHTISNLTSDGDKDAADSYWFSKPNPSRFAIENLYFDVSEVGNPSVVDSLLIDPITPDVYFHVYHSNEGSPGTTPVEWDEKLWTRVPKTFRARTRETHILPEPVAARYMKIEFSHLQPRPYNPGPFQQPIRYQKHPKWVLDYFLARMATEATSNQFIASRVEVRYNALDLAYNYYLDDLKQEPNAPVRLNDSQTANLTEFFQNRTDQSDQIDNTIIQKIQTVMKPYAQGLPGLVGDYPAQALELPTEFEPISIVSSLNRDAVVFEQSYPVMFFYLTARHRYREVEAQFTYERAYFVGVRQVAFLRERYSKATDTTLYVEIGGDTVNLVSSDFVRDNNSLVISSE